MRAVAIVAALLFGGCGDNNKPNQPDDAGVDAAPDATTQPLAPCLDRPTDLARPPTGQLPCDLLPPGFAVQQP